MKIAKLYDRISESYDLTDRFIANSHCRNFAMDQINAFLLNFSSTPSVVDLGVGDGEFLRLLQDKYPAAQFTGVDIADKMLELARKKLDLKTIKAPLDKVNEVLPANTYDVIVAHFVLAYVQLEKVLQQCSQLQKDQGVVSLITTTFDSFTCLRNTLNEHFKKRKILGFLGSFLYKRAINKTSVPGSFAEIKKTAEKQGYEVMGHHSLFEEVYFANIENLAAFGIKGGWFITAIDYPYVPFSALNFLAKVFARLFVKFPMTDHINFEVVLLRKK